MNLYQKKYEDLIFFRKNILSFNRWNRLDKSELDYNLPQAYGEYHHIKPRSLYPSLANDPDNIVCLTAYEHILTHQYLVLWYTEKYGKDDTRTSAMIYSLYF